MQPRSPIPTNVPAIRRRLEAHTGILQSHQDRIQGLEAERQTRTVSLQELEERLAQRIAAGVPATLIASVRGEISSVQAGIVQLDRELNDLRSTVQQHGQRLDDHDLRFTQLGDRVEGVEVTANATAVTLRELRDGHSWVPLALAGLTGLITYVMIEVFRPRTATNIQWCWVLVVAAVVGLVAGSVLANRRAVSVAMANARASARSGGQAATDVDPPVYPESPTAVMSPADAGQPAWQPGQPVPVGSSASAGASASSN